MEERFDKLDKNIADLTEITIAVRDRVVGLEEKIETLATKVEMNTRFDKVDQQFEGVNGKIEGLHRRIDSELEERKKLEDTVSKISVHVFPELAK